MLEEIVAHIGDHSQMAHAQNYVFSITLFTCKRKWMQEISEMYDKIPLLSTCRVCIVLNGPLDEISQFANQVIVRSTENIEILLW